MTQLLIYGASDDCIEFDGVIREEYYTETGRNTFAIDINVPNGDYASFEVTVEYDTGWEISLKAMTEGSNIPIHVIFGLRPDRDDDPAVCLHSIPEEASVLVTRL